MFKGPGKAIPTTSQSHPYFPPRLRTRRRLLIGPTNSAGQGYQWVTAVAKNLGSVSGHCFRFQIDENPYPDHYRVELKTFRKDRTWAEAFAEFAEKSYTHIVFESNRPIFGSKKGGSTAEIARMRGAGLRVAMLAHGSDVRIPSAHAEREKWHQYQHMDPEFVRTLDTNAKVNVEQFRQFDGKTFVSTPGLLDFVPEAQWCPVVVDPKVWACDRPVLTSPVPVVAHIPSSQQKGSEWIDPILQELADRGVVDYLRLSGIPLAEMPSYVSRCDILIDQFGTADYGVAACEAMATGRMVVSRIADSVRARVLDATGLELPIVEANPDTLREVILAQLDDRESARAVAARGPEFIRAVHDGRQSAAALGAFLDEKPAGAVIRSLYRTRRRARGVTGRVKRRTTRGLRK